MIDLFAGAALGAGAVAILAALYAISLTRRFDAQSAAQGDRVIEMVGTQAAQLARTFSDVLLAQTEGIVAAFNAPPPPPPPTVQLEPPTQLPPAYESLEEFLEAEGEVVDERVRRQVPHIPDVPVPMPVAGAPARPSDRLAPADLAQGQTIEG